MTAGLVAVAPSVRLGSLRGEQRFTGSSSGSRRPGRATPTRIRAKAEQGAKSSKGAVPGVANTAQKAAWYGVEAFGKLAGRNQDKTDGASPDGGGCQPMAREEVMAAIRRDYEENKYFVSGVGDMSAYEANCKFADPFVSFNGVGRFKDNVSNLGAYLQDVELEILDWKETDQDVDVRWRFSCVVDLPWKPKLAAAGGTTHVFSPDSGKVVEHIERWDVDIDKILKSLMVPASKLPTSRWEVFMMSLAAGDVQGLWLVVSGYFIAPTAALLAGNFALSLAIGEGKLPLPLGILCWITLASSVVAEVQKLTGVGTSNGGKDGGDAL